MVNLNENIENCFRNIVSTIEDVYKTKLKQFDNITSEEILNNSNKFYELLDDNKLFLLFINSKIKVFSSKDDNTNSLSMSLFGDHILLKNVFNNQSNENKYMLWDSLYNLYHLLETNKQNREDRLKLLNEKLDNIKLKISHTVRDKILPDDVNSTTTNMVDDIIGSFQDLMSDNKNPFENIMNITTKISEKYYKDIEKGNVEVDKLLKNMPFPGNKGGDGETGMPDMGNMMKSMEGMMDGMGMGGVGDMMDGMGMGGVGDMMKGMMGEEKKETTVMDENFSTADVDIGDDEIKEGDRGMVGNMMNMANKLPKMDGLPKLGELGDIMGDLKNITSNKDGKGLDSMKNKMDSFMEKSLGIDMNEFNKNMENLVSKMGNEDNLNTSDNQDNNQDNNQNNNNQGVNSLD